MKTSRSTRTLDNNSYAENPGGLILADDKLRVLRPDLYGATGLLARLKAQLGLQPNYRLYLEEQLLFGASNPASSG